MLTEVRFFLLDFFLFSLNKASDTNIAIIVNFSCL